MNPEQTQAQLRTEILSEYGNPGFMKKTGLSLDDAPAEIHEIWAKILTTNLNLPVDELVKIRDDLARLFEECKN